MLTAGTRGVVASLTLLGAESTVEVKPVRPSEVRVGIEDRESQEASESHARRRNPVRRVVRTEKPTYIVDVELRINAETGGRCAYVFMRRGDPASAEARVNEALAMELATTYGPCPNSPRLPNGALAPAAAAQLVWEDIVELPDPEVRIAPGHAITGKPAYLEVLSPRTLTHTTTAFGQTVELTVTSVLDVDWGDGTPPQRNLTEHGGPWPDGDITHVYTDLHHAAPVKITQRWQARWRVGTETGVIADQLFTESTLPLEVRQIQAVRER